jgi:hypothetical protein
MIRLEREQTMTVQAKTHMIVPNSLASEVERIARSAFDDGKLGTLLRTGDPADGAARPSLSNKLFAT